MSISDSAPVAGADAVLIQFNFRDDLLVPREAARREHVYKARASGAPNYPAIMSADRRIGADEIIVELEQLGYGLCAVETHDRPVQGGVTHVVRATCRAGSPRELGLEAQLSALTLQCSWRSLSLFVNQTDTGTIICIELGAPAPHLKSYFRGRNELIEANQVVDGRKTTTKGRLQHEYRIRVNEDGFWLDPAEGLVTHTEERASAHA